jgi:hypothetical protein
MARDSERAGNVDPTADDVHEGSTPPAGAGVVLGARLRCSVCGSQAVVTKAGEAANLRCHGQPLEVVAAPGAGPAA